MKAGEAGYASVAVPVPVRRLFTYSVGSSDDAPLPPGLSAGERRDIEVFRDASRSVVNITSIVAVRRNFFSLDVTEMPGGSGSGFIWDRRGHVVTNFHVLEGGRRWTVTLADQSTYEARPVDIGRFNGSRYEILAGATVGEEVAVEGVFLLKSALLRQAAED